MRSVSVTHKHRFCDIFKFMKKYESRFGVKQSIFIEFDCNVIDERFYLTSYVKEFRDLF